jgi:hypothetical protein
VSFLIGRRPREDRELAEAARRREEAFARDIGDEQALARSRFQPSGSYRPRRRWTPLIFVVLVAFALIGAIPLLRAGSAGGLLRPQCDHPALGLSAGSAVRGHDAAFQAAGPAQESYVVALDADRVSVSAAGAVTASPGRVLAGPFSMPGCRSAQTLFPAPAAAGDHLVTLFQRTSSGYVGVVRKTLKVR